MHYTRSRSKRSPVRRAHGAHPSSFVLIMSLLLFASVLLVGAGIVALLLAPFAILTGVSLSVCSLSLLSLVGIAKGYFALARMIARWLSHLPMCSALLPAINHLQFLLARMLATWLVNWLAHHDSTTGPQSTSSGSPYQTRISPQM